MYFDTVYSNSYTIDFWMYVQDISKLGDKLLKINFENIMNLSVGYDPSNNNIASFAISIVQCIQCFLAQLLIVVLHN